MRKVGDQTEISERFESAQRNVALANSAASEVCASDTLLGTVKREFKKYCLKKLKSLLSSTCEYFL